MRSNAAVTAAPFLAFLFLTCSVPAASLAATVVDFDIVYVRQPRYGDLQQTIWPEVFHPARAEPGADLVLLHPDGSEEVLVAGGDGAVTDPFVTFDGRSIYYSYFYDLRPEMLNYQRDDLPKLGSDIFRYDLDTGNVTRLTAGEFTPNTGAGNWDESNPLDPPSQFNRLGYGILNLGPVPVAGGRIAFTSNRNGFEPPKGFTAPTLQLFVMDRDGSNVEPIAPMTISSALHPTPLLDGRLLYSSHESQGIRDRRLWGLWAIAPDGRSWSPVISAFNQEQAFHFMTQLSDGDLVVVDYYNLNNNGFGALYRMPLQAPPGVPAFGSPIRADNPSIEETASGGFAWYRKMSFTPHGLHSITPFTHSGDSAAPVGGDGLTRVGKFTHPSAAPGNALLTVWTPGPANDLMRPVDTPRYDGGLYLIPGGDAVTDPDQLILIKNDPAYNEAWPRAVVPYQEIYGVPEPMLRPWLPNDGSQNQALPPGTPYALVGSSSLYKRDSFPGHVTPWNDSFDGLDAFNTGENGQSSNWFTQGADAGRYDNGEIWAVRLLAMEPNTHRSYGPNSGRQFESHANERLRILGEVPVRKQQPNGSPVLDLEGNPDTSFLVKIPADTPFTFQTLDRQGRVLNMAQTWHQVRPGEMRVDCGGCHAHSQLPLDWSSTAAGQPGFAATDLTFSTPLVTGDAGGNPTITVVDSSVVDVEFLRDIRPLLQRSCLQCHSGNEASAPAGLVLDDLALENGLPGDYRRLADDEGAQHGIPPVIANGTWRQTNASRYVRRFQSRRSLLVWKVFGERLDGWSNADHPSASTPGDPATLPAGADPNDADIDFVGTMMPPPGSGAVPLSDDEKRTIARWIDLGAPIDLGQYGWFLDDLKPTLHVSRPVMGDNPEVSTLRFSVADAHSGIDPSSISVESDGVIEGRAAGAELVDLFAELDGVFSLDLSEPLATGGARHLFVEVRDNQGNVSRVARRFTVGGVLFADGFESGSLLAW